jgi:hypothetical protein
MDGPSKTAGGSVEVETIPWGGTNDKDMLGIRAATAASEKSDPNYGGCTKEGSIPASSTLIETPTSLTEETLK